MLVKGSLCQYIRLILKGYFSRPSFSTPKNFTWLFYLWCSHSVWEIMSVFVELLWVSESYVYLTKLNKKSSGSGHKNRLINSENCILFNYHLLQKPFYESILKFLMKVNFRPELVSPDALDSLSKRKVKRIWVQCSLEKPKPYKEGGAMYFQVWNAGFWTTRSHKFCQIP